MSCEVVKLECFKFTGEIKSCEIDFKFTCEIRAVKFGEFTILPIAPVCGAVKLGGDIYCRYIPLKFTTSQGATGAVGRQSATKPTSHLHRQGGAR